MSEIVIQGTTPGIRVSGTGAQVTVKVTTGSGGGGGVTDHNALTGRSGPDQHPIGAVTGLQDALDAKVGDSDQRLSDARTPTAHKSTHGTGGTDEITPADIGAAEETHAHAAADRTSGVVAPARRGTGPAGAATVVHAEGTCGPARGAATGVSVGPPSRYTDRHTVLFPALGGQTVTSAAAGSHYFVRCDGSGQVLDALILSAVTVAAGAGEVAYISAYTEVNGGPGEPTWSQAVPISTTGTIVVTGVNLTLPRGPYWLGFLNPAGNQSMSSRWISPVGFALAYMGNGNPGFAVMTNGQSTPADMSGKSYRNSMASPGENLVPFSLFAQIGGSL